MSLPCCVWTGWWRQDTGTIYEEGVFAFLDMHSSLYEHGVAVQSAECANFALPGWALCFVAGRYSYPPCFRRVQMTMDGALYGPCSAPCTDEKLILTLQVLLHGAADGFLLLESLQLEMPFLPPGTGWTCSGF